MYVLISYFLGMSSLGSSHVTRIYIISRYFDKYLHNNCNLIESIRNLLSFSIYNMLILDNAQTHRWTVGCGADDDDDGDEVRCR